MSSAYFKTETVRMRSPEDFFEQTVRSCAIGHVEPLGDNAAGPAIGYGLLRLVPLPILYGINL
jgi:hypothetical protein